MRRLLILIALLSLLSPPVGSQGVTLPLKPNSVRFAVIGDMGTGSKEQYETAQRMVEARQKFPFDFVIMVGDNIYGSNSPRDMEKKFEIPYKALLDGGVKFYAALGNHDDVSQRLYKHYNMNGKQFYTFKQASVRFFALDSNYMTPEQLTWLVKELQASGSDWKIPFFHHPVYSSGGRHGSSPEMRQLLEPLFLTYKVQVVFQGHDHVYERTKPQGGIVYFVEGSSGKLRSGDLKKTSFTAAGFDTDCTFMLVEIAGDEMYFQTISRSGKTVDSGVIPRGAKTQAATTAPATPANPASSTEAAAKPASSTKLVSKPASSTAAATKPVSGTEGAAKPTSATVEKPKPTSSVVTNAKSTSSSAAAKTQPASKVATKSNCSSNVATKAQTSKQTTTVAKAKQPTSPCGKVVAKAKTPPKKPAVAAVVN